MSVLQRRPDVIPCLPNAYASIFTRQLSQLASVPSKFGTLMVFLVSGMPPASALMLQVSRGQIPSKHWITRSCSWSNTEDDESTTTIKCQFSNCRGSATMIANVLWSRDATECVSWHCDGLMMCQMRSTLACMCNYISFYVYKNSTKTVLG